MSDYSWRKPPMPKTFDPSSYCPVCENRGFTHGACIACHRSPAFQVTRIGDDHLVTRGAPAPAIPSDKNYLFSGGARFNTLYWSDIGTYMQHVNADPTEWRTWPCIHRLNPWEKDNSAYHNSDWKTEWDKQDICVPYLVTVSWNKPMIYNRTRKQYGVIHPGTSGIVVEQTAFDAIMANTSANKWSYALLDYFNKLRLTPNGIPEMYGA